jgi:hypothetical protein
MTDRNEVRSRLTGRLQDLPKDTIRPVVRSLIEE